jgi:uncharacterized phage-associated protein
MFCERIEAWAHGPVVRDVYPVFAAYGYLPITALTLSADGSTDSRELTAEEAKLTRSVWENYKGFSPSHLWKMTHSERPWIDARGDAAPADRCENEITTKAMKEFFDKLAEA